MMSNPDAIIVNIISATVDRLRQRKLTCSRGAKHDCCLPQLPNELTNYRIDFDQPLQTLCERLQWSFELLRQIANEWQARNSSEANLFGFDSTITVIDNLWRDEIHRRNEWNSTIARDYRNVFGAFHSDVGECLMTQTVPGKGGQGHGKVKDVVTAKAFASGKPKEVTVQVRNIAREDSWETA